MEQGLIPLVALVFKRECTNGSELETERWFNFIHDEPLFGPQSSPKLIASPSSGNSVEFKVRRAPGGFPLRFGWTMVTSWSWMVWPKWSMNTVRRLGCRVLGFTLRTVGLRNTSRPVHRRGGCVLSSGVQGLAEPGPPVGVTGESNWALFWWMILPLSIVVCFL